MGWATSPGISTAPIPTYPSSVSRPANLCSVTPVVAGVDPSSLIVDLVSNVATAGKLDHKLQDDVTNRSTRLPEHVKAKNATKKTFKVVEGLVHTIWYNVSGHSTRRAEPLEARVDTATDGTFYISQVCEVENQLLATLLSR